MIVSALISIHAPTRGATCRGPGRSRIDDDFNPRSHEGSDFFESQLRTVAIDFNPRSHEGSDGFSENLPYRPFYFNPRSHEGSDFHSFLFRQALHYFNPRSHEGSDLAQCVSGMVIHNFNPRSHEGSDCFRKNRCKIFVHISIHAPTRGATALSKIFFVIAKFQSTLPRGERPHAASRPESASGFQSTLPRGERQPA